MIYPMGLVLYYAYMPSNREETKVVVHAAFWRQIWAQPEGT